MKQFSARWWFVAGLLGFVFSIPLWLHAGPVTVPDAPTEGTDGVLNPFIAGQPAKAAEVMHNFKVLAETVNALLGDIEALDTRCAALETAPPARGPRSTQVFTQSGEWVRPEGITRVWVRLVGGGGKGGTGGNGGGGGGGGGGYAEAWFEVLGLDRAVVTVGGGGVSDGSASSFGDIVRASGGRMGSPQGIGGRGGLGEAGDILVAGQAGSVRGSGNGALFGGTGGSSVLGGGGVGGSTNSQGEPGGAFGGGGGASTAGDGGDGAPGVVIVWEYE